jgi:N-methylhydantoinase B
LQDVRNEIVSRKQAEETYGVVLTDTLEIDLEATEARRRQSAPTTSEQ